MNDNKFLTLLMGECWHELIPYCDTKGMFKCKICEIEKPMAEFWNPNPDHLSNPLPVIRWMERNMPEVWDDYLHWCFQRPRESSLSDDISFILDLHNLVSYLSEHRKWGITICSYKKEWPRTAKDGGSSFFCEQECKKQNLPFCDGTGVIKHPALVYLEQEA